jgi:hypothetical protein
VGFRPPNAYHPYKNASPLSGQMIVLTAIFFLTTRSLRSLKATKGHEEKQKPNSELSLPPW